MAKTLRNQKMNQIIYISIGCVIALAILIVALFSALNKENKNEQLNLQIGENENTSQNSLEQASSSIGKKIEETDEYTEINETESIQTENLDETQVNNNETEETISENSDLNNNNESTETENEDNLNSTQNTETNTQTSEQEVPKDPTFVIPVEGEIVKKYGKEKLIYSETLKEWTTHLGIDIKADKTAIVKSASDGTIKSIKNDPRYGLTVVIEHENGFSSVYSNLLTAEFVVVGENVESGQTIGTVGNSATFEILDDPHLHFEILKDGNSVDPEMYIK